MCKNILGVVLFLHLGFAAPTPALAQVTHGTPVTQVAALRGLDSIYVRVGDAFDEDAKAMGLSLQDVRTKVELELRRTGIVVKGESSVPFLFIEMTALPVTGRFAFNVSLELSDFAVPSKDVAFSTPAVTWKASFVATAPASRARNQLMDALQSLLNKFLNDYLAANPRQ